jgi:uncharacterized protein YcgI (DUF1989 family)
MTDIERTTIPASEGRAARLARGQHIRIINTHGSQVVDMWAFNASDPGERMSMHHTKSCLKKMFPAEGEAFYTYRRRPILSLVEDHTPGVHDVVLPACDRWRYVWDGYDGYHASCGDNLTAALEAIDFPAPAVTPQPLNLWMNCPIATDGAIAYVPPVTAPGDFTTFAAEMDCVVAMSACPYDLEMQVNGPGGPTEVHYQVW